MSAKAIQLYAARPQAQIFRVSIQEIQDHLQAQEKDKEKTLEEEEEFLKSVILAQFHDLLPLFSKKQAETILPH